MPKPTPLSTLAEVGGPSHQLLSGRWRDEGGRAGREDGWGGRRRQDDRREETNAQPGGRASAYRRLVPPSRRLFAAHPVPPIVDHLLYQRRVEHADRALRRSDRSCRARPRPPPTEFEGRNPDRLNRSHSAAGAPDAPRSVQRDHVAPLGWETSV